MMAEDRPIAAAALSTAAPSLAPDEVGALVGRLYGIHGSVKSLAGERDQNCCIETADGSSQRTLRAPCQSISSSTSRPYASSGSTAERAVPFMSPCTTKCS